MAEITKKVQDILDHYVRYKESFETWRNNVSEDLKFNTPGGMWKQEQVKILEARGQAALEIPIIKPQIQLQKSQIIGKSPQFKVIPRTDGDVKRAKLFSEICNYIWYVNHADMVTDEVVTYQLETGKAYFYVWWDPFGDDGDGQIRIEFLHPLDVIPDPESRRRDEEDSDRKYIRKMISAEVAKRLFPMHTDIVDSMIGQFGEDEQIFSAGDQSNEENIHILDEIRDIERDKVLYLEEQRKITVKYFRVKYPDPQDPNRPVQKDLTEKQFNEFKKSVEQDPYGADLAGNLDIEVIYKERVHRTCILGTRIVYEETLPTRNYTIIPVPYEHKGNPYTISLTRIMKGLQQEVNKRRSLMIAHAAASTNFKLLVPKGSVEDIEVLEDQYARPGAIVEYESSMGAPVPIGPSPLPNALYQLEATAKHDAQYLAGSFGLSHGDTQSAPDTYRGTLMLDEFASRRIGVIARNLYYALNMVGRICVDFIQAYMTKQRIIRIVNPYDPYEQETTDIGINLQDTYDDATLQLIQDVTVGKYDVQVIVGSMAPNNRYAELDMYKELLQIGVIDDVEFLKKTDLFDREGVLKRKGQLIQAMQQLQQLGNQNKELQKRLQETYKALDAANRNVERTQADKMYDRKQQDLEAMYDAKLLELDKQINELQLVKKEVKIMGKEEAKQSDKPKDKSDTK